MKEMIEFELNSHKQTIQKVIDCIKDEIQKACELSVLTIKNGGKIILFGNGGSAADAQHIAAELTGRYKCERDPLPAIALTTDTSALTAVGNDYGFDYVFLRQAKALARKGDLLFGISTSGNSKNVLNVLEYGKKNGISTLGLSGKNGGEMSNFCDLNIIVPSNDTARIQEMHILIGHIIAQAIDNETKTK